MEIAKNIAYLSGKIMLEYFDGVDQQRQIKSDGSELTIADTSINHMVIQELNKHFDDGIIGEEESTASYGMGRKWFCDPIDGTKGFVQGMPTATFSLGLVVDGKPVLGVVYDPFLDRLYHSVVGQGSFCNKTKLSVSQSELSGNFVFLPSRLVDLLKNPEYSQSLMDLGAKTASMSGAVYKSMLVARGKFVGFTEPKTNPHDIAAAQVIVQEAGGKVTGLDGKPLDFSQAFNSAIVSNGVVHQQIVDCAKLIKFQ